MRRSRRYRSDRSRLNIDLGFEGAVNGTLVRDLEQLLPLIRLELSYQVNLALDSVDLAFLCFAVPAIRRVNFRMTKINGHALERPLFRSCVPRYGHRRARTQRGEKQIIGSRPAILSADFDWFICGQPMRTDNDLLGEPRGITAHNNIRGIHARTLPSSRPAASRVADILNSLLRPQRNHRIHAGGAAGGDEARYRRYQGEQAGDDQVDKWIQRFDLEQDGFKRLSGEYPEEQGG